MIDVRISVTLLVLVAVVPISMLFYFMDRHWYHRLLQGAVAQAIAIETKYAGELPEIQLGSQIANASPVEFGRIWKLIFFFVRDKRFRDGSRLHSDQKIEVLYKSVIWGCIGIVVIYGLIGGIQVGKCSMILFFLGRHCS